MRNLLHRYYRWRLNRNPGDSDLKEKVYKTSPFANRPFGGLDLTFFTGDRDAYKRELTLDPPDKFPERAMVHYDPLYTNRTESELDGARHTNQKIPTAPYNPNWVNDIVWTRTPLEWAYDKEKNEAHMPWKKPDKPAPPRSEVWKWDTGQEKWVKRSEVH